MLNQRMRWQSIEDQISIVFQLFLIDLKIRNHFKIPQAQRKNKKQKKKLEKRKIQIGIYQNNDLN